MSYAQYLSQLLRPLGVYDVDAPYFRGELETQGAALDGAEAALDEVQRESCVATARDWGLEQLIALLPRRPAAEDPQAMAQAVAALLRISGDSFTLSAINDTLTGCGVAALAEETGVPGTVAVSFPHIPGIPKNFQEISAIIADILPAHLRIDYRFWYITWAMLEERLPSWKAIEDLGLTWEELEAYVEEETP